MTRGHFLPAIRNCWSHLCHAMLESWMPCTGTAKPYKDFPFFPHGSGPWVNKIQGKLGDFKVWEDPDTVLQTFVRDAGVNFSLGKSDPADDLRPGLYFASGRAWGIQQNPHVKSAAVCRRKRLPPGTDVPARTNPAPPYLCIFVNRGRYSSILRGSEPNYASAPDAGG
jgi:hypothetical protein